MPVVRQDTLIKKGLTPKQQEAVKKDALSKGYEWIPSGGSARRLSQQLTPEQSILRPRGETGFGKTASKLPSPYGKADVYPIRQTEASVPNPLAMGPGEEQEAAARMQARVGAGIGLTSLGAGIAGPGLIASSLGGAAGNVAAEGLDYALSPPQEKPTLMGAAGRTALVGGLPMLFGGAKKLFGTLSPGAAPARATPVRPDLSGVPELPPRPTLRPIPQGRPLPPKPQAFPSPAKMLPEDLPAGAVPDEQAIGVGADVLRQVNKALGEKTTERAMKEVLIEDLSKEAPMVDMRPLLQQLKGFFTEKVPVGPNFIGPQLPGGISVRRAAVTSEMASARQGLSRAAGEIQKEGATRALAMGLPEGEVRLPLNRALAILSDIDRTVVSNATRSGAPKEFVRDLKEVTKSFREQVDTFVAKTAPHAKAKLDSHTSSIRRKLDVAEELSDLIGSDPKTVMQRLTGRPDIRRILDAFDNRFGTDLSNTIDDLIKENDHLAALKEQASRANTRERATVGRFNQAAKQEAARQSQLIKEANRKAAQAAREANTKALAHWREAEKSARAARADALKRAREVAKTQTAALQHRLDTNFSRLRLAANLSVRAIIADLGGNATQGLGLGGVGGFSGVLASEAIVRGGGATLSGASGVGQRLVGTPTRAAIASQALSGRGPSAQDAVDAVGIVATKIKQLIEILTSLTGKKEAPPKEEPTLEVDANP